MDAVSLTEETIKNHPLIDFSNGPGLVTEHWVSCPCGYSTRRYRAAKTAHKAFEAHIAEEINEALIEAGLLTLNEESKKSYRGRTFVPTRPLSTPAFA